MPIEPEFQTDFQVFWQAYPRRAAKKDALKAWRQLNPDTKTVQAILDALSWQTRTDQWRRGIIPLPASYLRGERWEDERPASRVRVIEPYESPVQRASRLAFEAKLKGDVP